jgi:hypothetical protein
VEAILWNEPESSGLHPEDDSANLAKIILEREVDMSGRRDLEVGNLSLDPDI